MRVEVDTICYYAHTPWRKKPSNNFVQVGSFKKVKVGAKLELRISRSEKFNTSIWFSVCAQCRCWYQRFFISIGRFNIIEANEYRLFQLNPEWKHYLSCFDYHSPIKNHEVAENILRRLWIFRNLDYFKINISSFVFDGKCSRTNYDKLRYIWCRVAWCLPTRIANF